MVASKAIGIDLGTSYCCVGVWQDDHVEIIANDRGDRTTPSYVSFGKDMCFIGDVAKDRGRMHPRDTVFNAKRFIGRNFDDPDIKHDIKHSPFEVFNKGGKPYVRVQYRGKEKELSPEEIISMVLLKMKETAESYLGTPVHDAVIAVPSQFNALQRQAIMDAGTICGMNIFRFLNDPSAAVTAYEFNSKNVIGERNVLIFDLGGGMLSVSLLTIEEGILEVKACAGNTHLGGEDFDNRLINHCSQVFMRKNKRDLFSDPRAIFRLRIACERAKRNLSMVTHTSIEIDNLFEGIDFYLPLTRDYFEELCQDLFHETLEPIEKVLRDSKMNKDNVHEIVLVGGSTRIPRIAKLVSNFFNGKELTKGVNPDEAVAYGAAIHAAIFSGDTSELTQDILLLDVAPLSLGVETPGGIMSVLIKRNTSIPTKKTELFPSLGQDPIAALHIYEGERIRTVDNHFFGVFKVTGAHPSPVNVKVTFDIDVNGIPNVILCDEHGKYYRLSFTGNKSRLSREEIEFMIEEHEKYKADEEAALSRIAAQNSLESFAYGLRNALVNLGPVTNSTIAWLEDSQERSKAEYEEKQKELEAFANSEDIFFRPPPSQNSG